MATVVLAVGDAGVARVYEIQLSLDGHRVLVAQGPADAVELCRSDGPSLVVSDAQLPEATQVPMVTVVPGMTAPQLSRAVRRRLAGAA